MTGTRTRRWRAAALTVALGASLVSMAFGAPSAVAQDPPGPDEIVTSPNMTHLANVPFQQPLADGAVGTDMAFSKGHAIVGNYNGFTIYNVKKPSQPKIVSNVLCPGAQNDVSVHKNLLFLSVDSRRSDDSCSSTSQNDGTKPYWEGVRIFDISDLENPRYLKSVKTQCGSHTHTLVPGKFRSEVYLYVSSYGPSESISGCQPPHDKISIIKVPIYAPTKAAVVATPVLFPDGGYPGANPPTIQEPGGYPTQGCHDITVYPKKDLAAGACM
ncbi:MAG: LVIVD repeat-containing protein, partial [Thermocrispum sp.]